MPLCNGTDSCCLLLSNCALPAVAQKPQKSQTNLAAKPAPPRITLSVDATEAPRKILHARLTIPATPGVLTLDYPKWIPGEHGPTGPDPEPNRDDFQIQWPNPEVAARSA